MERGEDSSQWPWEHLPFTSGGSRQEASLFLPNTHEGRWSRTAPGTQRVLSGQERMLIEHILRASSPCGPHIALSLHAYEEALYP